MHLSLKINDHFCHYDYIKDVRNYLLKLVNTKIVSRSETVQAWLFEDFYPSFEAAPETTAPPPPQLIHLIQLI